MIQPINQNLNSSSAKSLKPVEVPHFTGITKVVKTKKADSFTKAKVKDVPKLPKKNYAENLKKNTKIFFSAAKQGTKEGVKVIADVAKKGAEFTSSVAQSLYSDTKDIIRAKGTKAITSIDGLF